MASEPKVGDVRAFDPQDELLKRWAETCHKTTIERVASHWQDDIHPADALVRLSSSYHAGPGTCAEQDARRLSGLILAELSAAREMREVLREVEWRVSGSGDLRCPCCFRFQEVSHAPDCRLARLIGGGR